jgi:hypothetical protein
LGKVPGSFSTAGANKASNIPIACEAVRERERSRA